MWISSLAGTAGYPATATWLIAPPGALQVFMRLYDVETGSSSNTVRVIACPNMNCTAIDRVILDTVSNSLTNARIYATPSKYSMVRVEWTGSANVASTTPFKIEYASRRACDAGG